MKLYTPCLLALTLFSASAQAMSASEAKSFRNDCVLFGKASAAKQVKVAATIGFTVGALKNLCHRMLTHTVAEDERIYSAPNGHYTYTYGSDSPGSPTCSTDSHGHTSCSYQEEGSGSDLNCGSSSPGTSTRCTDSNGLPSNVSCYTNQSGYTSCN